MNDMTITGGVLLVRHGAVAARYRGLCYGRSDVELHPSAEEQHRRLAVELSAWPIQRIVHSGLTRTRLLAEALGAACGIEAVPCSLLQERDFGAWELQPWEQIHAEHGEELTWMLTDPGNYRPGGGETTFELRDRVLRWFNSLPNVGWTVAVTHGGPIAALQGTLRDLPVEAWPAWIPPCGGTVWVPASRRPRSLAPRGTIGM
jgi:broad specificity phosphatase PhoE